MRGELLKGSLDLILLAILESGPRHGYAVVAELRRRSGGAFDLPEGTIYPALHRLEAARLLTSRWSSESGRRRRVYSLSRRGRAALRARRAEWQHFTGAVAAVVG
jgi:PadR family transcriptional regulator PadR